jgi:hypothetical protein
MSIPVSLLLTTYNQERFVRFALESLLLQQYSGPLELVLIDDASTDNTWSIIESVCGKYQGNITLKVERQSSNLGPANNTGYGLEKCSGEVIVRCHGDDMNMPDRVDKIVKMMQKTGAMLVSSNAILIDEQNQQKGLIQPVGPSGLVDTTQIIQAGWTWHMLGATYAWNRKVTDVFGWFKPEELGSGGDHVLPLRGALLGGFGYIGEPLLCWRRHSGQLTARLAPKDCSPLEFSEVHRAHSMMPRFQCLRDLMALQAEGRNPQLAPLETLLRKRIMEELEQWVIMRAQLYGQGYRPLWEKR